MSGIANSRNAIILVIGDILAYVFSLVATLAVRYGEVPDHLLLATHLPAFSVLFVVFLIVNYSAGLYDNQIAFIRGRVEWHVVKVQIVNAIIGVFFFYFAPIAIAPKANLLIYFLISTALVLLWRAVMFPVFSTTRKVNAVLLGGGEDMLDLKNEVNQDQRYGLVFKTHIENTSSLEEVIQAVTTAVESNKALVLVVDLHNSTIEAAMPYFYSLIFSGVQVIDASKLYEAVLGRIPVSLVGERWLVENSSLALGNRLAYDILKRLMDIIIAGFGAVVSLIFYPFVYLAIKLDDGGPIFISQERVGSNGKMVKIVKFRSMSGNDAGKYGQNGTTKHRITRVGSFLRRSRIDEVPQLWNVVWGDLSLVGPRSELPPLVKVYEKAIPYYNVRHLVKPGLFGWAQIYHEGHPHHAVATEDTRDKLSYDLYYIKNRSLTLDLKIMLRTIQILMSRSGK